VVVVAEEFSAPVPIVRQGDLSLYSDVGALPRVPPNTHSQACSAELLVLHDLPAAVIGGCGCRSRCTRVLWCPPWWVQDALEARAMLKKDPTLRAAVYSHFSTLTAHKEPGRRSVTRSEYIR
jgi:hypothetical protein